MAGEWYLLKSADKEVFGPTTLESLRSWASEAKISPLDKISKDGRQSWVRAPMVPELQMDWLIEMPDNYLYGPTNVGTIQEFLATGEIDEHVVVINCAEGVEGRLSDQPFFQASPHHIRSAATTFHGTMWPDQEGGGSVEATLLKRLNLLERENMELQRAVNEWQEAYEGLKQQFVEATGHDPQ